MNTIINKALIPTNFNRSTIVPIVKDKSIGEFAIGNYRPISVSNALAQLYERLILDKCPIIAESHQNQFGFKKKISTIHSFSVVHNTIEHFIQNGSAMYVVSLDAEKAFDKVWRPGLFFKLLNKIPLNIWCSLNQYYNSSDSLIKINGQTDTENVIKTNCGVKQGSFLSPNLFNI